MIFLTGNRDILSDHYEKSIKQQTVDNNALTFDKRIHLSSR